jgi:hypothetical protein
MLRTPWRHVHLLPQEHLLDTGYVSADLLVTSQQRHQVDMVGPVLGDNSWQAQQPDGLDIIEKSWKHWTINRPAINGRAERQRTLKGPGARFSGLAFSAGGLSPWR